MSSLSSEQFMAGLVFPDSSLVLPHDIGYTPTMASPDTKRSPKVTIHPVSSIHGTLSQTVVSPTIRVTPPREDRTTPVSGRKASGSSSRKKSGSKKSRGSPREAKPEPIVRPMEDCVSESRSISTDWLIEDLIRDGMLDVDAVHTALGLGLPSPPVEHTPRYPTSAPSQPTRSPDPRLKSPQIIDPDILIRKPGGLLCPIPEETEDISDAGHSLDEPTQLVDLWEAACRVDTTEETSSAESSILPTPVVGHSRTQWYF